MLSGNEVYCMNALILLMKIMLCSKLHCQKVFKLKLFSYNKGGAVRELRLAEEHVLLVPCSSKR